MPERYPPQYIPLVLNDGTKYGVLAVSVDGNIQDYQVNTAVTQHQGTVPGRKFLRICLNIMYDILLQQLSQCRQSICLISLQA